MAVLIFKLRNVPDDEADDIRALLEQHQLDYYETSAGNWGISSPGIWLKHDSDREQAQQLIDEYQQQRGIAQREAYQQLKSAGQQKTLWQGFRDAPLRFVIYLILAALVAYVSIKPFLSLGASD